MTLNISFFRTPSWVFRQQRQGRELGEAAERSQVTEVLEALVQNKPNPGDQGHA